MNIQLLKILRKRGIFQSKFVLTTACVIYFSFYNLCSYYSDADLPVVSSKDTQTDNTGDGSGSGDEKSDEVEKKENVKQWSIDRIRKEYRKFNIDLAPKV